MKDVGVFCHGKHTAKAQISNNNNNNRVYIQFKVTLVLTEEPDFLHKYNSSSQQIVHNPSGNITVWIWLVRDDISMLQFRILHFPLLAVEEITQIFQEYTSILKNQNQNLFLKESFLVFVGVSHYPRLAGLSLYFPHVKQLKPEVFCSFCYIFLFFHNSYCLNWSMFGSLHTTSCAAMRRNLTADPLRVNFVLLCLSD